MQKITIHIVLFGWGMLAYTPNNAQGFFKKLKEKANQAVEKAIDKKIDPTGTAPEASNSSGNSSSKPSNTTGGGLKANKTTDVSQQITDAETATNAGNFSDARNSIQTALIAIEIQIGKQLLQNLPATVASLPKDTTQDLVTSAGYGWNNLNMVRIYRQNDKQFSLTIGSNNAYAGIWDLYFNNSYAMQGNSGTPNMKPTKINGNKAIIKFDASEGYTLLVKLGQAGLLTMQGINFASEEEITAAASSINIDSIKKTLGEQ